MKRVNKLLSVLAAGVLFAGALAGCGGSKETKADTIKIGGCLEMTGGSASYGISSKNGIELALKNVNQKGRVFFIGELHVGLFARHEIHGHLGQVFHHHAAVVRHLEVGVFKRALVGRLDYAEAEGLRRLPALQERAVGDTAYMVALGAYNRIDSGERHVDSLTARERVANVVDDALRHERPHGIMEHEVHVLPRIGAYGGERGVVAFFAAFEYALHLLPAALQHDVLHVGHVEGVGHNGYFADVRVALEGIDGVLHNHFAGNFEKLLRRAQPEAASDAAREDYGNVWTHDDFILFVF